MPTHPTVAVLAPTPRLTVTIESIETGDDIHLHAGGQGIWVAGMLARLDVDVLLSCPLGGETGAVLSTLLDRPGITIHRTRPATSNGAYVHDRRSGSRHTVADVAAPPLGRHDLDDLYGRFLVDALASDACVLGGPDQPGVVSDHLYGRLAEDLARNGATVVVDLTGGPLAAVLEHGVTLLKISDEELGVAGQPPHAVEAAARALTEGRVPQVVVTSASGATVAIVEDETFVAVGPDLDPIEPRGAGDSFTATYTAALARGLPPEARLRHAVAAGALNVTRHGLASGDRCLIESLAERVVVEPLSAHRSRPLPVNGDNR